MIATRYPNILLKDNGTPMIDGTRISVLRVVKDVTGQRYRAEELPDQYPGLTLGQVYSALADYYDNQEAMENLLEEDRRDREQIRKEMAESQADLIAKIRARMTAV